MIYTHKNFRDVQFSVHSLESEIKALPAVYKETKMNTQTLSLKYGSPL